jgi:hypothetical protein
MIGMIIFVIIFLTIAFYFCNIMTWKEKNRIGRFKNFWYRRLKW